MATIDNSGHEVVDLPPSAYHDVPTAFEYHDQAGFLFNPTVPTWGEQRYAAHLAWRYGNSVAQAPDPRAFLRLTGV